MKKIYILFATAIMAFASTSCEDWLSVSPKDQIEVNEFFETEAGFKDALTGAYIQMSSSTLYGRNLTYGILDAAGNCYYNAGSSTSVTGAAKSHTYTTTALVDALDAVWAKSYSIIANLNELIAQMETADQNIFSKDNYNVIKGEALGLRAFMHFDMLRMFAPAYTVDSSAPAIPYVTEYTYNVTGQSSVAEATEKIIADLLAAKELLKASDPVITKRAISTSDDNGYLLNRFYHFNYYACLTELARVYLYKNDLGNAKQCAQEVVNAEAFYTWTKSDAIATPTQGACDRTFSTEQIFALQIDDLESYVLGYNYGTVQHNAVLALTSNWLSTIWPTATHSTDLRRIYLFSNNNVSSNYYTTTKFWQVADNNSMMRRMPIMRLPELYLILAESDLQNGDEYLNTIREHRGVTSPAASYTNDNAMNDEITLEYMREFVGEGQMFYRYKRLNADQQYSGYYFRKATFNTDWYVFPMPEEEIEYGQRK